MATIIGTETSCVWQSDSCSKNVVCVSWDIKALIKVDMLTGWVPQVWKKVQKTTSIGTHAHTHARTRAHTHTHTHTHGWYSDNQLHQHSCCTMNKSTYDIPALMCSQHVGRCSVKGTTQQKRVQSTVKTIYTKWNKSEHDQKVWNSTRYKTIMYPE